MFNKQNKTLQYCKIVYKLTKAQFNLILQLTESPGLHKQSEIVLNQFKKVTHNAIDTQISRLNITLKSLGFSRIIFARKGFGYYTSGIRVE